jgi:phosphatidylserine/phosphatidylglycerophosphate/cardiolipin synthase-like enzyme
LTDIDPKGKWARALGLDYTHGNTVRPLLDGGSTFEAIYSAMETARLPSHFIYLLAWWMDDLLPLSSHASDRSTLKHLIESKAASGVQIRVMMWLQPFKTLAAHDTPEQLKALFDAETDLRVWWQLVEGGMESLAEGEARSHLQIAAWINSLKRANGKPADAAAIVDWLTARLSGSHHQKMLCVRGEQGLIGFCGGVDINADRVSVVHGGKGEPLHDVHCEVRGPAAADLVRVFVQRWIGHPDSASLDKERHDLIGGVSTPSSDNKSKSGQLVRVACTFNRVEGGKYSPNRRPCKMERTLKDALMHGILGARRFIYFEDQYMTSLTVADLIYRALPNVQHVTALITDSKLSDLPQVWRRRREFIDRATKNGALRNFYVYYLVDPSTGRLGTNTYVHAKTWIFDDEFAYIGSANMNNRGLSSDSEVGVFLYDGPASSRPPYGVAQSLRIHLWEKHLGVTTIDGAAGYRDAWRSPSPPSRVRTYAPDEDKDPVKYQLLPWEVIDPDAEDIPVCTHRVQLQRLRQL